VDDLLANFEVIGERISLIHRFLLHEFRINRGRPGSNYPTGGEAVGPSLYRLSTVSEALRIPRDLSPQVAKGLPFEDSNTGAGPHSLGWPIAWP
jgi:hypothetical protein